MKLEKMTSEIDQNKKNDLAKKPEIVFQNMLPGVPNSALTMLYKEEVLPELPEDMQENAKKAIEESPPRLYFSEPKEVFDFYKKVKNEPVVVCCDGSSCSPEKSAMERLEQNDKEDKEDNDKAIPPFIASAGTGTLYEGTFPQIKEAMEKDIHEQKFGSDTQGKIIDAAQQIEKAMSKRDEDSSLAATEPKQQASSNPLNPFDTSLKKQ